MKVIALYGKANTGKTSALNTVAEGLKAGGATIIETVKNDFDTADRRYLIKLADGRMVCITTAGDDAETQEAKFIFVKKCKPEIWITASHERDESADPVKDSYREGYSDHVTWIRKLYPMVIIQNEKDYKYKNDEPPLFLESICDRLNRIDSARILNMIFQETT